MPYAIRAKRIPSKIPSMDAWTINIGALKINKSIEFKKKCPLKKKGALNISYYLSDHLGVGCTNL